jgi:creatinine amidohydrolase
MQWAQRTWLELRSDIPGASNAAILPVGATEQHGPHMGCGMDTVFADELCRVVGEKTGVPILPIISYGCSLGHSRRWPGTIAIDPILLTKLVESIGNWAYYSGIRRLFIVNTHLTNAAPLRSSLELLRAQHDDMMIASLNTATLSERVRKVQFAEGDDWHANDAETSLMLAIAPDMVRETEMRTADDPDRTGGLVFAHPVNRTSLNGATGSPSLATKEKGEKLFSWMVEDLCEIVRRGLTEKPPLDYSYSEPVQPS